MKLVCIRHPRYDGSEPPVLSCKTCCGIFIDAIKAQNERGKSETEAEWLDRKAAEARGKRSSSHSKTQFGFSPDTV